MVGLYFLNVTIHLLAAMFWLGGMFFLAVVGAPSLRELDPALRATLFQRLGERFRTAGWIAIAVLLVTGVLNLSFRGVLSWTTLGSGEFWSSAYGQTLAWKLSAVAVMVVVSVLHDFWLGPAASRYEAGSQEAQRARRRAAWLARLNALAGVVVVVAAVRLARGG
jgi:putative copper export protein